MPPWRGCEHGGCVGVSQLDSRRWAFTELDRGWYAARRNSCRYSGCAVAMRARVTVRDRSQASPSSCRPAAVC